MFHQYLGAPQFAYWRLVASEPIPAGYSGPINESITIGDWGAMPFNMVWYVRLNDPGTGEVFDWDTATCAYSPDVAVSMTSDAVGAIEKSIRKAGQ
jgi:hypothetical protein